MALEDIEKLKDKVAKDPNSKLFVPLADEYRKAGMFDEAIDALLKGLENQPGYMSARVSLGKVYLEKNMVSEAKQEFEKVIISIPDNLFAQKKLAEIYRDAGDKDNAIARYKTVLKLNPIDEDAMSNLNDLQKTSVPEQPVAPEPPPVKLTASEPVVEEEPVEEIDVFPSEEPQTQADDDFEAFKRSLSERSEGVESFEEKRTPVREMISEDGIKEPSMEAVHEAIEEEGIAELDEENVISEADIENIEKEAASYAEMFKEPEPEAPVYEPVVTEEPPVQKPATEAKEPSLQDAEAYVAKGEYSSAVRIYKEMLSANPGDKRLLQKIEELRMLLKMLGKGQDELIAGLEAFREGIRKKRDEFFRNS